MASIEDNVNIWSEYDWSHEGHEWSASSGGTEFVWWGTLFPRIHSFIPTGAILEIAPGYGRCTRFLKGYCNSLIAVDLTERCVEACQRNFADDSHCVFHLNDGKSLSMVPDGSIDFIFSYDSLVHADAIVIESYLRELATKLRPEGVGFIHHSNLNAHIDPKTGQLPFPNPHWRDVSMSAELFDAFCGKVGLQCVAQELINWGSKELTDCFSVFTRPDSPFARPKEVLENSSFQESVKQWFFISKLYKCGDARLPIPHTTEWRSGSERRKRDRSSR